MIMTIVCSICEHMVSTEGRWTFEWQMEVNDWQPEEQIEPPLRFLGYWNGMVPLQSVRRGA